MAKNAIICPISDTHSGGSTALFPPDIRYFKHGNHTPFSFQKRIFEHWMKCAKALRKARARKKLIVVHNGDALEGSHHNTPQTVTILPNEQIALHVELMKAFLTEAGFKAGDELYYVTGTETHVGDNEDDIGRIMQAVPNGSVHAFDELELDVNGNLVLFAHQGPGTGRGINQGNAIRNYLRDLFVERMEEKQRPPDFVVFSHRHKPYYSNYVARMDADYHVLHGMITPSFQAKTRFGYKVAALQQNKIGLQWFEITGAGDIIAPPVEMLM